MSYALNTLNLIAASARCTGVRACFDLYFVGCVLAFCAGVYAA